MSKQSLTRKVMSFAVAMGIAAGAGGLLGYGLSLLSQDKAYSIVRRDGDAYLVREIDESLQQHRLTEYEGEVYLGDFRHNLNGAKYIIQEEGLDALKEAQKE